MSEPSFRSKMERRSAVVLVWLRGLPRAVPGVAVLGMLAGGLALRGLASGVALAVVAVVLIWLVYLSWPVVPATGRVVRVGVICLILAAAVGRSITGS